MERFMVFNPTFNNISVISWQLVLLEDETELPRENSRSLVAQVVVNPTT
jgi:hypothetical protein